MDEAAAAARSMWKLYEPVHTVTYFAPEAQAAFEEIGLRGFWRGYFAGRAAPLGPVGPAPVTAAFFSFAPSMAERALPAVWQLASPEQALAARSAGAVAALRRLLGQDGAGPDAAGQDAAGDAGPTAEQLAAAAGGLAAAAAGLDGAGRPLGGPNAALPVPDEPLARLWQAATVLREHRGDGHVAALVAAGFDGCESVVLRTAVDLAVARGADPGALTGPSAPRELIQPVRGWTDAQWEAAAGRLAGRGLIEADGSATPAGLAAHRTVEAATDLAAARPWARLGPAATRQLAAALRPLARAAATALPFPNPVGIPRPAPAAG